MPTGIIPDNDQKMLALSTGQGQLALKVIDGRLTVGLSPGEVQVDLPGIVAQGSIAGQGFVGCLRRWRSLSQPKGVRVIRPGLDRRLGKPAEPTLIFPHEKCIAATLGPAYQAVTALFFAHSAGQGW